MRFAVVAILNSFDSKNMNSDHEPEVQQQLNILTTTTTYLKVQVLVYSSSYLSVVFDVLLPSFYVFDPANFLLK